MFTAPTVKPAKAVEFRFDIKPGGPLPWEAAHELRRVWLGPQQVWRYTLCGGIFGMDRVCAVMEELFGRHPEDVDEWTPTGQSALFGDTVSADGQLMFESLVLSTAVWSLGRARKPGPRTAGWLDGFDLAQEAFRSAVPRLLEPEIAAYWSTPVDERPEEPPPIIHRLGPQDVARITEIARQLVGDAETATGSRKKAKPPPPSSTISANAASPAKSRSWPSARSGKPPTRSDGAYAPTPKSHAEPSTSPKVKKQTRSFSSSAATPKNQAHDGGQPHAPTSSTSPCPEQDTASTSSATTTGGRSSPTSHTWRSSFRYATGRHPNELTVLRRHLAYVVSAHTTRSFRGRRHVCHTRPSNRSFCVRINDSW
jgi:hypothetical protein